jgi:hypothetical protein
MRVISYKNEVKQENQRDHEDEHESHSSVDTDDDEWERPPCTWGIHHDDIGKTLTFAFGVGCLAETGTFSRDMRPLKVNPEVVDAWSKAPSQPLPQPPSDLQAKQVDSTKRGREEFESTDFIHGREVYVLRANQVNGEKQSDGLHVFGPFVIQEVLRRHTFRCTGVLISDKLGHGVETDTQQEQNDSHAWPNDIKGKEVNAGRIVVKL